MASRIHANDLETTIVTAISAAATTILIADYSSMPSLGSNHLFMTLRYGATWEIVKVTAHSAGSLTVVRAQEGSSASIFPAGATISCNTTRDSIDLKQGRGDESTLTIASGVITITSCFHKVDTESAAASDDLDTINGCLDGQILTIRAANSARTVVLKDGTGNLKLAGDCTLDNEEDTITLIYSPGLSKLLEIARSDNGA